MFRVNRAKTLNGHVWTEGAIHSTKMSGNFGPELNGSVRSNRKSFEKTGPLFEVDQFSRSDRLEFWLNGSRPRCSLQIFSGFSPSSSPLLANITKPIFYLISAQKCCKGQSFLITVSLNKCLKNTRVLINSGNQGIPLLFFSITQTKETLLWFLAV